MDPSTPDEHGTEPGAQRGAELDAHRGPGAERATHAGTTCLVCGYDLRGLSDDGTCPECGAPIAFSIRGDLYRFTDPDRLARMALGGVIVSMSLLLAVPWWFFLNIADNLFHSAAKTGTIAAAGSAAWLLTHATGWWMLTEREAVTAADSSSAGRGERARVWTRDAVLLFLGATLGAILVNIWRSSAWGTGAFMPGRRLAAALWLAGMVAGVGLLLTGMRHVMAMGRRLPTNTVGSRAEFMFLLVATISGMMALSAAVGGALYGLGVPEAVGLLGGTCGCMSLPLWAVALIGVMVTTHNIASSLRLERAIALELRRERKAAPGAAAPTPLP